ncbi:MAG: methyltransferase, partial [Deltaproteobacteria bacterium]|nr:methyltransferase [Deltaproteobacteria bacterium]
LLVERVLPDRVEHSIAAEGPVMSDLTMMVISGGRERTSNEYQALLRAAGFEMTNIIPTRSEVSVVECVPVN